MSIFVSSYQSIVSVQFTSNSKCRFCEVCPLFFHTLKMHRQCISDLFPCHKLQSSKLLEIWKSSSGIMRLYEIFLKGMESWNLPLWLRLLIPATTTNPGSYPLALPDGTVSFHAMSMILGIQGWVKCHPFQHPVIPPKVNGVLKAYVAILQITSLQKVLLMDEILHQLIGRISHSLQDFYAWVPGGDPPENHFNQWGVTPDEWESRSL